MAEGVLLSAKPEAPAPPSFPEVTIRNVTKIGIDEMQAIARARNGKVRCHDGIGPVPPSLACSCVPWCGDRYFPNTRHLRDLTWSDIKDLLVRNYGQEEYDKWVLVVEEGKRNYLSGRSALWKEQGSDGLYPSYFPIPYIVENALNHDFHEHISCANPDRKERDAFLRRALAPLVVD